MNLKKGLSARSYGLPETVWTQEMSPVWSTLMLSFGFDRCERPGCYLTESQLGGRTQHASSSHLLTVWDGWVIETDTDIMLQRVLEPHNTHYCCSVGAVKKKNFCSSLVYFILFCTENLFFFFFLTGHVFVCEAWWMIKWVRFGGLLLYVLLFFYYKYLLLLLLLLFWNLNNLCDVIQRGKFYILFYLFYFILFIIIMVLVIKYYYY